MSEYSHALSGGSDLRRAAAPELSLEKSILSSASRLNQMKTVDMV